MLTTAVRFQENILTKGTAKLNKVGFYIVNILWHKNNMLLKLEESLSEEFRDSCPDHPSSRKELNFVLVGPFTEDLKIATGVHNCVFFKCFKGLFLQSICFWRDRRMPIGLPSIACLCTYDQSRLDHKELRKNSAHSHRLQGKS